MRWGNTKDPPPSQYLHYIIHQQPLNEKLQIDCNSLLLSKGNGRITTNGDYYKSCHDSSIDFPKKYFLNVQRVGREGFGTKVKFVMTTRR